MRKELFEFYPLSKARLDHLWDNAIFVFDANVLLNVYKFPKEIRDNFLDILAEIKDRIWIPHQFAYEYHKNRLPTIRNLENAYSDFNNSLNHGLDEIKKKTKVYINRHPQINVESEIKKIEKKFDSIKKSIKKKEKNHPDYENSDIILQKFTSLFRNKVGKSYSHKKLKEIYSKGKERYENKIPPGFGDLKNKSGNEIYGDLVGWFQILDYAKEEKKDIIFITDDDKKDCYDWWQKNKKPVPPRVELRREIKDFSGQDLYMYRTEQFMRIAKDKLSIDIKEDELKKVKDLTFKTLRDYSFYGGDSDRLMFNYLGQQITSFGLNIRLIKVITDPRSESPDPMIVNLTIPDPLSYAHQSDNKAIVLEIDNRRYYLEEHEELLINNLAIKIEYVTSIGNFVTLSIVRRYKVSDYL